MDKEKIKGQANIDIFNLRMAQKQGVITEFGKGKLEALEGIVDFIDSLQEESVSEDLDTAIGEYCTNPDNFATWIGGEETDDIPLIIKAIEFGAQWQKGQIIKRLCNHANIDQMVEKFEDKYKTKKVVDTEYYKRGIFDAIKAIKKD